MKGAKPLFIASWILLLVLAVASTLVSLLSLNVAYFGAQDQLTATYSLADLKAAAAEKGEAVEKAFRGRRVTAATMALAWGILSLFVVLVPYRRGERWAWWALLISVVTSQLLSLARALVLVTDSGLGAAGVTLGLALLGLLLGVPRMFAKPEISEL